MHSKQNLTHEIQSLVDRWTKTQLKTKWVEKSYTFVDSSLHKQRLITQGEGLHSLLLSSMDFLEEDGRMDSTSSQEREPLSIHTKESIDEEMSGLGRFRC